MGEWLVVGGVVAAVGLVYAAWVGAQIRSRLRRTAQQHHELRRAHREGAVERDRLLEHVEHATAFCQRLLKATQSEEVYHVILREFAELATPDSEPPWATLWLYDPARYGFVIETEIPPAQEQLAADYVPLKDAPFGAVADQNKPLLLAHAPETVTRLLRTPLTGSEAAVLIPLSVEDHPHALVLMICSPAQLAEFQRNLRVGNLVTAPASLSLGNLLHREVAIVDPLTRVYNIAHFHERLANELQRCQRFDLALSLLLVDIDGFKNLNDTYGHQAGDLVLLGIVQTMRNAIRSVDLLARYGGDEFVLLLPETGREPGSGACEALPVAQRIRLAVAEQPFDLPTQPVRVTVSIGVSIREAHATPSVDAATLFKQADEQLYRAKRAGRNRCAVPDGFIAGPS